VSKLATHAHDGAAYGSRELRAIAATSGYEMPPFVLMTAANVAARRAAAPGVDAVVAKPFDITHTKAPGRAYRTPETWGLRFLFLFACAGRLTHLRHFDHIAEAARADIHIALFAIQRDTPVLHIHRESAVGVPVRVADIASILRLAHTYITASGH
jgi:hypothetical protein